MKDKFFSILFSNRFTGLLFLLFPTAMALGTFIESWYSLEAAKILIYNSWWFELILFFLIVNFLGNIFKYNLLRKEKWAVLLLHLSFILIILGAFVTRNFGYEGIMPIREGISENKFLSEKTYLTINIDGKIDGDSRRKKLQSDVLFSENVNNYFKWKNDFNDIDFTIEYIEFIEDVVEDLVLDESGERYIKIVEAGDGQRHDHYIKEGDITSIHNILFTLNKKQQGAINIRIDNGVYFIDSPFDAEYLRMADQYKNRIKANVESPLQLRSLYSISNFQFVIPDPALRGKFDFVKSSLENKNSQNLLRLKISSASISKTVDLLGGKGIVNQPKKISLNNLDFHISYGSLYQKLPFSIKLKDFIAEKYPGTENSYASFMSKIVVEDDISFDYDIFMNHVLDHRGFRFFQASFDPDEKGTVLSVNHDWWGTSLTYSGYILLYIGLMGIFFIGKTRFKDLSKSLEKIAKQKLSLILIFSLIGLSSLFSQNLHFNNSYINFDSLIKANTFDSNHAAKFGKLVIQDYGGRMKPANTFSSELLRKVSKKDHYLDLNSDQVLLSIMSNPAIWYNVPIIYLKRGNDSIRKITGLNKKDKYAPLISLFDTEGNYKIVEQLEQAYRSLNPNQFEKDFIELDRRVNLLYSALEGKIMRIFPIPKEPNNKWVSFPEITTSNFSGSDSLYVKNVLPLYFQSLRLARENNNYTQADNLLESISGFQLKFGSEVVPSKNKIKAEILYNKYDVFKNLYSWYIFIGIFFFIFLIIQIFKDNNIIKKIVLFFKFFLFFLFSVHSLGLIVRAFISGHAPWSDAYESMLYVAWATQFFGLVFGKKSSLTLASASFVTGMILMIAHWNWMDPSIANLQPVLDSYWLMIHVSVIVGSYGPFALGMILGIVSLFLMLFINKSNKIKIQMNIKELTIINELSITVGLIMLTIGNFLGAMWANESWGRYWGWDPKETWALISIMIYAFVIHMRLIPGLKGPWFFNLMSVLAFSSIMMTYFGVNFYLVGLHSYASGDKIITPNFVYYSVVFVFILGILSYLKKNRLKA